jgi:hypothetical protein
MSSLGVVLGGKVARNDLAVERMEARDVWSVWRNVMGTLGCVAFRVVTREVARDWERPVKNIFEGVWEARDFTVSAPMPDVPGDLLDEGYLEGVGLRLNDIESVAFKGAGFMRWNLNRCAIYLP